MRRIESGTRLKYLTPALKRQCGRGWCKLAECPFQEALTLQRKMFATIAREQILEPTSELDATAKKLVENVVNIPDLKDVRYEFQGLGGRQSRSPRLELRGRCHRTVNRKGVETTCLGAARVVTTF